MHDEKYLYQIREYLKSATRDIETIKDITEGEEFYSVQIPGDLGIMVPIYFWDFRTARNYYELLDRGRKAFFQHNPDGTRKILNRTELMHKSFDYHAPIKDIYSVPCGKIKVIKNEAFLYFSDAVYCYRFNNQRNYWKLIDIKKAF